MPGLRRKKSDTETISRSMDQKIYYLKRGVQFYDQKHVVIIVDDYIKRWVLILWAVKFLPHRTRVTEDTSIFYVGGQDLTLTHLVTITCIRFTVATMTGLPIMEYDI